MLLNGLVSDLAVSKGPRRRGSTRTKSAFKDHSTASPPQSRPPRTEINTSIEQVLLGACLGLEVGKGLSALQGKSRSSWEEEKEEEERGRA